jgi:hypothetical protein
MDPAHCTEYYHSTALINSFGTGKTKAAYDLGEHIRVVYVGLHNPSGLDSCPLWAPVYQVMFDELSRSLDGKAMVARKILYTLVRASLRYQTPLALKEAQFSSQKYLDDVECSWESYSSSSEMGDSSSAKAIFTGDLIFTGENPLLIVIDGGIAAAWRCGVAESNIRAFKRAITEYQSSYILFLSTSAGIARLTPQYVTFASRTSGDQRLGMLEVPQVLAREEFPPLFSASAMNYYTSPFHPFSFGRPLWSQLLNGKLAEDLMIVTELVKYASVLLGGGSCRKMVDGERASAQDRAQAHTKCLAMFGSRFSLTAKKDLAKDMVQGNMAVVSSVYRGVDVKGFHVTCTYPPEPVLAEAAACWMSAPTGSCDNFVEMLRSVEREVGSGGSGCVDVGDVGEMMTAVYLTYVLDQLKYASILSNGYDGFQRSYVGDVAAVKFLAGLWGSEDLLDNVNVETYLKDCYVNFSHIYRRADMNLSERDLHDLYLRGCAVFCGKGSRATDIVLPIKISSDSQQDRYGVFMVQVENGAGDLSASKVVTLLTAMNHTDVLTGKGEVVSRRSVESLAKAQVRRRATGQRCRQSYSKRVTEQSPANAFRCVKLLMSVGAGYVQNVCEIRTLQRRLRQRAGILTRRSRCSDSSKDSALHMCLNLNEENSDPAVEKVRKMIKSILNNVRPSLDPEFEENINAEKLDSALASRSSSHDLDALMREPLKYW